ncbi:MAG: hypothetical protein FJX62_08945 [Alphaproteobacteria bacterium]|nr:hypothetical protein [Alphaproteobacteria bacterium]
MELRRLETWIVNFSQSFARLLPLLAALLVFAPQPAGKPAGVPGETSVALLGRDSLPAAFGDFITRKNRHAGSIDEYFAIDDDADQYAGSQPALSRTAVYRPIGYGLRPWTLVDDPRPGRRARAHLSTGPPQA